MHVHGATYRPLRASSYINLPKYIADKKACINVKNKDQKCFLWSVLAGLHPSKIHPERLYNYKKLEPTLEMGDIEYPVALSDIDKFEHLNHISVNVLGVEDKDIFPLRVSRERYDRKVTLMLITKGEKRHYVLVKNLSRLLHDQNKHHEKKFPCPFCLHLYSRQDLLDKHLEYCSEYAPQRVEMPDDKELSLYFKNYQKKMRIPFVIYAGK